MIDLNSEEMYNALSELWIKLFEKLVQELKKKDKEVILVAMSRKMPRLIEAIKRRFKDTDILDGYPFITEHVLPYFLRYFNPDKQCIVIVDDAIYYGSTINQITSYIKMVGNGTIPYVIPLAISEVVGELPNANKCISEDERNVIKEKNIPFFTTQNAKHIIELCRPIDMEFPILRFEYTDKKAKGEGMDFVPVLKNHFKEDEIYKIEHRIKVNDEWTTITNYNILPQKGTRFDHWNKDFCKMRIFVSDKGVQVVAYAPGILSEDAIVGNHVLFSDDRIQNMWTEVQTCEMATWPDDTDEDSITKRIKESYRMQCVRSKVIWANYLASFLYLLEQKEAICNAISAMFEKEDVASIANFSAEDTRQLLPPNLVESITATLNLCFQEGAQKNSTFYGSHSTELANQELIPEECRADYLEKNRKGWQQCGTTNEALAIMFSNQHLIINDGMLGNDTLRRTQRLRFGVTYTALEKNLAFPIGIEGLWYAIHQWIDKNIDEGTVKPKYERVVVDGNAYWIRMFRAGENEESFTKMRRICEFIIEKVRLKAHRSYVERNIVEDLLTLAWEDPCEIVKHSYKWNTFDKKKIDSTYYLTYKATEQKSKIFLDFLIAQNYLQIIQDSSGVSLLSTIENSQVVTPLALLQEQAISDYVDAYYSYKKAYYRSDIMDDFFSQKKLIIN